MHLFQEDVRYDKMAEALGAHGIYVNHPKDFLRALQKGLQDRAEEPACRP